MVPISNGKLRRPSRPWLARSFAGSDLPADTPYRASHAIFVREGAAAAYDALDETPECLRLRPISLRAFDAAGMMVDADLTSGREVEAAVERLLENPAIAYIHAHYARPGCYAARIDRA